MAISFDLDGDRLLIYGESVADGMSLESILRDIFDKGFDVRANPSQGRIEVPLVSRPTTEDGCGVNQPLGTLDPPSPEMPSEHEMNMATRQYAESMGVR